MNAQTTPTTTMSRGLTGPFASLGEAPAAQAHVLTPRPTRGGGLGLQTRRHGSLVRLLTALAACACAVAAAATLASAASAASPAFRLRATSQPTNFVAGSQSRTSFEVPQYEIVVTNVGGAPTEGEVTVTDTLPAGLTPLTADISRGAGEVFDIFDPCDVVGQTVTCTISSAVQPGQYLNVGIHLAIDPGFNDGDTVQNQALISGGGAGAAQVSTTTTISSAPAPFGLLPGAHGLSATASTADGASVTQAGSHPYQLTVELAPSTVTAPAFAAPINAAGGGLRDLRATLPRGLIVDPNATPVRCTEVQLEAEAGGNGCPSAAQVGLVSIVSPTVGIFPNTTPLYNMVPTPDAPAVLGFDAIGVGIYVHVQGGVRAGDYALTADSRDILARAGNPVLGVQVQLWGDPSSPSHDFVRGVCDFLGDCARSVTPQTTPFLTMPTACSDSPALEVEADSWFDPGRFLKRSVPLTDNNGNPTPVAGCDQLDFTPSIDLRPTTQQAGSSSGMDVALQVPQNSSLNTLAEANLKKAVVTLPPGMTLNPSAADGLVGCTEAEIGLTQQSPVPQFDASSPTCPDGSIVGTATVVTPLLPDPLQGTLYVADPNDNPFHTLLSGYLVVHGAGVTIKLAGRFDLDPQTGRIVATFDNNPQLPFSELKLHFKSGSRGVLSTPPACGTHQIQSELSPWSGTPPVDLTTRFTIDQGCQTGGFSPQLTAGVSNPVAGSSSSFTLRLTRQDGEQDISGLVTTLPPGLLAKLAGVPLCPDLSAATGDCPVGSQIGSTTVGAGTGPTPLYVPQAGKSPTGVYLAGVYRDAPYSLVIKVPAQAGPFDLGTVVVRAGIYIDRTTAAVTVKSDPLPIILQGIPLQVRQVDVSIDRPSFMLNPTSCTRQQILAHVTSAEIDAAGNPVVGSVNEQGEGFAQNEGAVFDSAVPFGIGGCSDLDLSPKLAIALTGKGQTTDDKHPGVHATVSQTAGQTNLKKVTVSLPLSLALDPDNAQALCEFSDGSKADPVCPKGSIVGHATAHTPILDQPLSGPVYFVKNIRKDPKSGREIRTLPKLVIPLAGENGLRLNLVGTSNVVGNRLVTTFDNIPDAPVSDFTLDIDGGKSGILVVSGTDICKSSQVADQQIDGQNGKQLVSNVYLQTSACPLKIISKKVGKTTVAVKVGGLGAGKVTITGHGIKKTAKTITQSTVATITAKRTKGKPGRITVSFDPTGPAKARKTTK